MTIDLRFNQSEKENCANCNNNDFELCQALDLMSLSTISTKTNYIDKYSKLNLLKSTDFEQIVENGISHFLCKKQELPFKPNWITKVLFRKV